MLYSMTGYGQAEATYKNKTITAELRALNSKFSDIRMKIPQAYRSKEYDIRKIIGDNVNRGKLEFALEIKSEYGEEEHTLNSPLFKKYYFKLEKLNAELGLGHQQLAQAILRIPGVVAPADEDTDEAEWKVVQEVVMQAIENLNAYRQKEGAIMEIDCENHARGILQKLQELPDLEAERIEKMRTRIWNNLKEFVGTENIDANRFEQEVLFYIEKIDISEEKVRLEQNCNHFLEVLNNNTMQKGRKLNFISQEIGREINTLGAKANSSDIQRIVVMMKDELEKIKEMVANAV